MQRNVNYNKRSINGRKRKTTPLGEQMAGCGTANDNFITIDINLNSRTTECLFYTKSRVAIKWQAFPSREDKVTRKDTGTGNNCKS